MNGADMVLQPTRPADWARKRWPDLLFFGIPALAAVVLPALFGLDDTVINVLLYICIYMILALGLNVVVGFTGLLDLGYVSFMAVGAVVTALLLYVTVDAQTGAIVVPVGTTEIVKGSHPFVFPLSSLVILLASGLVCAVIGVLRGIPTLRLSGDYYAIVTLGFAEIIFLVLFNTEWLSGGAFGIKLTPASRPRLFGDALYWDSAQFYVLTLAILALTTWLMFRLQNSRVGRAWAAIRLDETAARSCGINVSYYKMVAFAVSGFVGGVGGSLYAIWSGTVAIRSLEVWQSILILCCIVLGGMGSIRGVLLGSGILMVISEFPRYPIPGIGRVPPEARYLVYGVLIILLMRFRPQGLIPLKPRPVELEEGELAEVRAASSPLFSIAAATAPPETGKEAAP